MTKLELVFSHIRIDRRVKDLSETSFYIRSPQRTLKKNTAVIFQAKQAL